MIMYIEAITKLASSLGAVSTGVACKTGDAHSLREPDLFPEKLCIAGVQLFDGIFFHSSVPMDFEIEYRTNISPMFITYSEKIEAF